MSQIVDQIHEDKYEILKLLNLLNSAYQAIELPIIASHVSIIFFSIFMGSLCYFPNPPLQKFCERTRTVAVGSLQKPIPDPRSPASWYSVFMIDTVEIGCLSIGYDLF